MLQEMLQLGRRDTDRKGRAERAPAVLRAALPVSDREDHTGTLS
jgi:hypothetical protein